jgi:hypothetical protein
LKNQPAISPDDLSAVYIHSPVLQIHKDYYQKNTAMKWCLQKGTITAESMNRLLFQPYAKACFAFYVGCIFFGRKHQAKSTLVIQ